MAVDGWSHTCHGNCCSDKLAVLECACTILIFSFFYRYYFLICTLYIHVLLLLHNTLHSRCSFDPRQFYYFCIKAHHHHHHHHEKHFETPRRPFPYLYNSHIFCVALSLLFLYSVVCFYFFYFSYFYLLRQQQLLHR